MTVAVDPKPPAGVATTGQVNKYDPTLPQVFGRFLLVQRLSRGGMGEIFLAKHGLQGFEKLCVIKKVLPNLAEDKQFISRFVDEAQVVIKLQHVNVAQVFEVGRVGDEYFLGIEYVEGRDLRRTLHVMNKRKRRFPPELALFVGREIANGLAYAHRRTGSDGSSLQLVHCDISPPNILVSFEGETKIIDFGIAKSALRATATDPKMGFGKFGYMAPEQLIRGGVVDFRTDIYAAGVVLFELLTGQRLYELKEGAPDYRALARAVSRGEHDLPSEIDPMLQPFDELVVKALRPRAEDRYQTAAELRDAIQTSLVAISPTISADALGSFMREVFADEMNAHHELQERVAHMHLEDFREQLTTASVATVSFALANMPLVAPPEHGPSPVAGTVGAPANGTGVLELSDLVPDKTVDTGRRRRWGIYGAIGLAAIAAIGVIAMAAGGGDSSENRTAAAVASASASGQPAPPPGPAPAPAPRPAPEPTITALPQPAPVPAHTSQPPSLPASQPPKKKHDTSPPQKTHKIESHPDVAPAAPDPDVVLAKFKSVSREYKTFKDSYGSRLDSEWTDLLNAAQYAGKSPDKLAALDRKIDHFRGLMSSAKQ